MNAYNCLYLRLYQMYCVRRQPFPIEKFVTDGLLSSEEVALGEEPFNDEKPGFLEKIPVNGWLRESDL